MWWICKKKQVCHKVFYFEDYGWCNFVGLLIFHYLIRLSFYYAIVLSDLVLFQPDQLVRLQAGDAAWQCCQLSHQQLIHIIHWEMSTLCMIHCTVNGQNVCKKNFLIFYIPKSTFSSDVILYIILMHTMAKLELCCSKILNILVLFVGGPLPLPSSGRWWNTQLSSSFSLTDPDSSLQWP